MGWFGRGRRGVWSGMGVAVSHAVPNTLPERLPQPRRPCGEWMVV